MILIKSFTLIEKNPPLSTVDACHLQATYIFFSNLLTSDLDFHSGIPHSASWVDHSAGMVTRVRGLQSQLFHSLSRLSLCETSSAAIRGPAVGQISLQSRHLTGQSQRTSCAEVRRLQEKTARCSVVDINGNLQLLLRTAAT